MESEYFFDGVDYFRKILAGSVFVKIIGRYKDCTFCAWVVKLCVYFKNTRFVGVVGCVQGMKLKGIYYGEFAFVKQVVGNPNLYRQCSFHNVNKLHMKMGMYRIFLNGDKGEG